MLFHQAIIIFFFLRIALMSQSSDFTRWDTWKFVMKRTLSAIKVGLFDLGIRRFYCWTNLWCGNKSGWKGFNMWSLIRLRKRLNKIYISVAWLTRKYHSSLSTTESPNPNTGRNICILFIKNTPSSESILSSKCNQHSFLTLKKINIKGLNCHQGKR